MKSLIIFFLVIFLSGCASMSVVDIDPSEVPDGHWGGNNQIVSPDFQLNAPRSGALKPGDCPDTWYASRPYGTPAEKAYCSESRFRDSERSCNMVFSTFGAGLCPPLDQYGQKKQQMDATMRAGVAAQNAVLGAGQSMSKKAQQKGHEFLASNRLSTQIGTSPDMENGKMISETVLEQSSKNYAQFDVVGRTRTGFYSDCIIPHINMTGLYKVGGWYYRVVKDRPACAVPSNSSSYSPDYVNTKTTSGASMVGKLKLTETNGKYKLCLLDAIASVNKYLNFA